MASFNFRLCGAVVREEPLLAVYGTQCDVSDGAKFVAFLFCDQEEMPRKLCDCEKANPELAYKFPAARTAAGIFRRGYFQLLALLGSLRTSADILDQVGKRCRREAETVIPDYY